MDYGEVSGKLLLLNLTIEKASNTVTEKSFGDIITDAERAELIRLEFSKKNLKTENRVNRNSVIKEGEDEMGLFGKNKKKQEEESPVTVEVPVNESVEQEIAAAPETETVETTAVEVEGTKTAEPEIQEEAISKIEANTEENMANENEENIVPADAGKGKTRKGITVKKVVVGLGVVAVAATVTVTAIAAYKKLHAGK
jgi:thiol:disulfide interchange protein